MLPLVQYAGNLCCSATAKAAKTHCTLKVYVLHIPFFIPTHTHPHSGSAFAQRSPSGVGQGHGLGCLSGNHAFGTAAASDRAASADRGPAGPAQSTVQMAEVMRYSCTTIEGF